MLLYLIMWVLKPVNTGTVTQKAENNLHKSSLHLIINESISDDDYVIISEDQLASFDLKDEKTNYYELNRLAGNARSEPNYTTESKNFASESYADIGVFTQVINEQTRHSPRKRDVSNIEIDYNYEYLINEYQEEAIHEAKSNLTYNLTNKDASKTGVVHFLKKLFGVHNKSCAEGDISLNAIRCVVRDYKTRAQPLDACVQRLWDIIRIWFFVYLALAIPLWCTRGLCCCCLFCKFFKPHQTIEEARRYLIMNPPGLLKTTKGHEVLYEPTRSERDSYEEFEHLVRTI